MSNRGISRPVAFAPLRRTGLPLLLAASLSAAAFSQDLGTETGRLDPADARILEAVERIVRLFQQSPDAVWPGFDLAHQPFLVYRPGAWALLVGTDAPIEGFTTPPLGWPQFEHPVLYHAGRLGDLIGQLTFDYSVGDLTTVAIAPPTEVPDLPGYASRSLDEIVLGFIVHEAFHQYQSEAFEEMPWAREERYPILDAENSALAALEMRLLADGLRSVRAKDPAACRAALGRFVAAREHRWEVGSDFLPSFEQGLELREGTAKYVEVRAIEQAGLADAISLTLQDLDSHLQDGAVSPDDMARNRIYPVGAALGLLLDFLGVEWQGPAARAGRGFAFTELLQGQLSLDREARATLLERVQKEHDYPKIVAASEALIRRYREEYESVLTAFEDQPGLRIEVVVPGEGLRRSRSSRARRWPTEEGRRVLCPTYTVYALESHELALRIEEAGVLEIEDAQKKTRTVVFYAPGPVEGEAAGESLDLAGGLQLQVDGLRLSGPSFSLTCRRPVSIRGGEGCLHLEIPLE